MKCAVVENLILMMAENDTFALGAPDSIFLYSRYTVVEVPAKHSVKSKGVCPCATGMKMNRPITTNIAILNILIQFIRHPLFRIFVNASLQACFAQGLKSSICISFILKVERL